MKNFVQFFPSMIQSLPSERDVSPFDDSLHITKSIIQTTIDQCNEMKVPSQAKINEGNEILSAASNLHGQVEILNHTLEDYENTRIHDLDQEIARSNEELNNVKGSFLEYMDSNTSTRAGGVKKTLKKYMCIVPPLLFGLITVFSKKPPEPIDTSLDLIDSFYFFNSII